MPFKTPQFWYKKSTCSTIAQSLLAPLSHLYNLAHTINTKKNIPKPVDIPVICIGNITAGGSGKTPTSIALNVIINEQKLFHTPCFLTRGYGAKNQTTRFISDHEPIGDTGDEPKILLRHCKTIISKNRHSGAKLAQSSGCDIIIMDDGYQNNTLKKDISFLIIDGKNGFGNQKLLPVGPLRETIQSGMDKADAIILIGEDKTNCMSLCPSDIPVFNAKINARTSGIDRSKTYLAFCGLAHPSKFFDTLKQNDINVIKEITFADHHPYTQSNIQDLISISEKLGAKLITTEKDIVKIDEQYHSHIQTLYIDLNFNNEKQVHEFLKNRLSAYIQSS